VTAYLISVVHPSENRYSTGRGNYAASWSKAPPLIPSPPVGNVIKLSIRALILEETLLKKGFFQAIFLKLLKVLGKGFKGKNPFPKGFSP
jgi:hypothetical protein